MDTSDIRFRGNSQLITIDGNLATDAIISTALTSPFPMTVSSSDQTIVNSALALLKNSSDLRPLHMANIQDPIFESVQGIDDAFNSAVKEYKKNLIKASASDMTLAMDFVIMQDSTLYAALAGQAQIVAEYSPENGALRAIAFPFLSIYGLFWGMFNEQSIIENQKKDTCSYNRKNWAIQVSGAEENRLINSIKLVRIRANVLATEIRTKYSEGKISHRRLDELRQIAKVVEVISNDVLMIRQGENKINANEFLSQFN